MQNVTWNANSQLELPGSAKSRTEQLIDLRACPGALRALDLQRLWNILGLSAAWSFLCESGRFRSTEHPVTERKGGIQTSAKTGILVKFIKFS